MDKSCYCDPVCDFCAKRQHNNDENIDKNSQLVAPTVVKWSDTACKEFLSNCDKAYGSFVAVTIPCYICGKQCLLKTAHRHQGKYIGDECCWDERLKSSE